MCAHTNEGVGSLLYLVDPADQIQVIRGLAAFTEHIGSVISNHMSVRNCP